jgi:hypothetical protein
VTDPKNIRLVLSSIRESLDGYTREQLIELLGYVFKEFVVEGSSPLGAGAGAVLDAKSELDGMRFSQVVVWLQQHLDLPELAVLEVDGEKVYLRAQGRAIAIEVVREPVAPPPAPPRPAAPPPSAGVTISSAPVQARPAAAPAQPAQPAAPQPAPTAAPAQPAPAAQPAQPAQKTEEPSDSDSRFSRLEID